MPFPRAPTGPQDSCVTPASVSRESRGPESYWIPAYAGKTLKNAVPSCADRPAGFLCDPCPPSPLRKQGSRSRPAAPQRTRHSPAGLLDSCLRGKTSKNAVSCGDLHFLLANALPWGHALYAPRFSDSTKIRASSYPEPLAIMASSWTGGAAPTGSSVRPEPQKSR